MTSLASTEHRALANPALPGRLLHWYRRNGRGLPWRARGREAIDPYKVWLSEVMLQQTTVAAVAPYFHDFIGRWPSLEDLAAAPLDRILSAWAGLGYYARARNLHACARLICRDQGGRLPESEAELRALPGIGPYSAAAIAAIAFGQRACVVDGNVERVIARLFAVATPLPAAKPELRALAEGLLPRRKAAAFPFGDYAQAMMDLGAMVCLPRRPKCEICPLSDRCAGRAAGLAQTLPRRVAKPRRPMRRGVVFWVRRGDGAILLRRRAAAGLLGGMMELPTTEWRAAAWDQAKARGQVPFATEWAILPGLVRHSFTHFHLELAVWAGRVEDGAPAPGLEGRWVRVDDLGAEALPSVMRKVVKHALGATGG